MWVGIPKNELKQLKRETVPCEFTIVIHKLTSVLYKMIYLFTKIHFIAVFMPYYLAMSQLIRNFAL